MWAGGGGRRPTTADLLGLRCAVHGESDVGRATSSFRSFAFDVEIQGEMGYARVDSVSRDNAVDLEVCGHLEVCVMYMRLYVYVCASSGSVLVRLFKPDHKLQPQEVSLMTQRRTPRRGDTQRWLRGGPGRGGRGGRQRRPCAQRREAKVAVRAGRRTSFELAADKLSGPDKTSSVNSGSAPDTGPLPTGTSSI